MAHNQFTAGSILLSGSLARLLVLLEMLLLKKT